MSAPTLTQRRAVHFRNQLLDRHTTDPMSFIERIALYSTSPTSHLGLIARVKGYRVEDLPRLVAERRIVGGAGVRGSSFFVPVDLVPMTVAVGAERRARLEREILGKPENARVFDRLAKRIERALSGTEMAGVDIRKAARPSGSEAFVYSWTLRLMAEQCRIVTTGTTGSWKSNRFAYRLWDEWLPDVDPFAMDVSEARVELARLYFKAHAPATVEDFAWWSGIKRGVAEVVADAKIPSLGAGYFGKRPPARLAAPTGVRLLPYWDAALLTLRDRTHVISDDRYGKVYDDSGNPAPVVLVDGAAKGVWSMLDDKKRLIVSAAPFGSFSAAVWKKIESEAELIAAATGAPDVEVQRRKNPPPIAGGPRNLFMNPFMDPLRGEGPKRGGRSS